LYVFFHHNINLSKLMVIADLSVEEFGSLIQLRFEATITDFLNVSLRWISDKAFDSS
jgi:hypothetical protein